MKLTGVCTRKNNATTIRHDRHQGIASRYYAGGQMIAVMIQRGYPRKFSGVQSSVRTSIRTPWATKGCAETELHFVAARNK